jgi:hypothetical protein
MGVCVFVCVCVCVCVFWGVNEVVFVCVRESVFLRSRACFFPFAGGVVAVAVGRDRNSRLLSLARALTGKPLNHRASLITCTRPFTSTSS